MDTTTHDTTPSSAATPIHAQPSRRTFLRAGTVMTAAAVLPGACRPAARPALAASPRTAHQRLWNDWIALWNGDLARAERIVAPDYAIHMAPLPGTDVARLRGPAGLAGWIGGLHTVFTPLRFTVQVEPLFDRDLIAGRWLAEGTYAGGFPGAAAAAGTPIRFSGADFLRVADGRIAEYWLSSDTTDLLAQLGMLGG